MWKDRLLQIAQEKNIYGEQINTGATEEEIRIFIKRVKDEFEIDLPNQYIEILRSVNGVEFNGFIFYGIDEELLDTPQNQHIEGFIRSNKIWYENKWQKKYIFLGESDISWYVYDVILGRYLELDNPSGMEMEVFISLDYLLEKALSDALN